ncbi:MAG: hypothetical protein GX595_17935 [Lentisphaerae bacterium]|nr:hypothetical protein [Lentisphaerota bacterium]
MNQAEAIEFVMRGQVDGVEITPRTIGLSQFNEFNQQAEAFLAGSERLALGKAHVEILEGSYRLRVLLPVIALAAVEPDLRLLAREDALGEIDSKRAEIVTRWQTRSKAAEALSYEIRPGTAALPAVCISKASDYHVGEVSPWVAVEKYLLGTVVDMGGAQKANVHVRLDDTGRVVKIGASQGYLHDQRENRLYHKILVHVRAEQHHRTSDLRNLQMIGFVDYQPVYDEAALDRFAAQGKEAWRDVADAVAWVRELRGGE